MKKIVLALVLVSASMHAMLDLEDESIGLMYSRDDTEYLKQKLLELTALQVYVDPDMKFPVITLYKKVNGEMVKMKNSRIPGVGDVYPKKATIVKTEYSEDSTKATIWVTAPGKEEEKSFTVDFAKYHEIESFFSQSHGEDLLSIIQQIGSEMRANGKISQRKVKKDLLTPVSINMRRALKLSTEGTKVKTLKKYLTWQSNK